MNDLTSSEPARSRDRILGLLLRSEGPLSVRALALRLGISRNAAHQHVAALEREGLVERDTSIRTKGRPSQGYRLSSAGSATFPRQYALIARQLLEELRRHLGPDELRSALQRIGASLADSLPLERNADPDEMIRSVAGLMRQLGYASQAVDGVDGPEIEAHNCVFHDLAMADQSICEVDLALLRSMTGRSVEHRRCMARGERSCRFAFAPREDDA
jgi:predicted ArsR family transcriptional regulator